MNIYKKRDGCLSTIEQHNATQQDFDRLAEKFLDEKDCVKRGIWKDSDDEEYVCQSGTENTYYHVGFFDSDEGLEKIWTVGDYTFNFDVWRYWIE